MIFERIILQNIGPYKGRNEVELSPKSSRRPIILFGALNGSGKTTFLDSLKLALYGKNASCASRRKLAYEAFLEEAISHGADPKEGAAVELHLSRFVNGSEEQIRLRRSWRLRRSRVTESLEVFDGSGKLDAFKTEHWDEFVEELIPRKVSDLFFFDGEKIEELADPSKTADIIRTGLHSLLGLDLVDSLSSDLKVIATRRSTESATHDEQKRIAELDKELAKLYEYRADLTQSKAEVRSKLDKLERKQLSFQERFQLEGGELYNFREEIERDLRNVMSEMREADKALRESAAGAAPLLLVGDLVDAAYEQATREDAGKSIRAIEEALSSFSRSLLAKLQDQNVDKQAIKAIGEIAADEIAARRSAVSIEEIVRTSKDAFIGLDPASRQEQVTALGAQINKLEALRSEQETLERKRVAVPSSEAVRPILEQLDALATEIRQTTISLAAITQRYDECVSEIEAIEAEKYRLLEHAANSDFAARHNKRVISEAQRIQSTLREFRNRVVLRHLQTLEGLITDACTSLFRKESFMQRVEILPSSYELKLFGEGNRELPKGRFSAGERQLIAVAVLWALARASGKPIPTIVDTPLGRLDGSHRQYIVENYFPSASHQVLVLSTDTEIDKHYHSELSSAVSREFLISYKDGTQSSEVKPGYFW